MKFRHRVRNVLAKALHSCGALQPERTCAEKLTIITFHRVLPEKLRGEYPFPGLTVPVGLFSEMIEFFAEHYRCMNVSEAWRELEKQSNGKPLLAITFDDGRKDNFQYAVPVLKEFSVPATFYVPAKFVGKSELMWHDEVAYSIKFILDSSLDGLGTFQDMIDESIQEKEPSEVIRIIVNVLKHLPIAERNRLLKAMMAKCGSINIPSWECAMDWNDLKTLQHSGHEIGAHSMTHEILRESQGVDLQYEIGESKKVLESELGTTVRTFSYPSGIYDDRTLQIVRDEKFETAVATSWGHNDLSQNPHHLNRIEVQAELNQTHCGRLNTSVFAWRLANLFRAA